MKAFKNYAKRGLAMLLAIVMCVGMLSLNAFAATETSGSTVYYCDRPEHPHDETDGGCYVWGWRLACTEPVTHTPECFDEDGEPTLCENSEHTAVAHTHHELECYNWTVTKGEPTCNLGVAHNHTEECYTLNCDLEHTHNMNDCDYEVVAWDCGEEAHSHENCTPVKECIVEHNHEEEAEICVFEIVSWECGEEAHSHENCTPTEVKYTCDVTEHTHDPYVDEADLGCYKLECKNDEEHEHVEPTYGENGEFNGCYGDASWSQGEPTCGMAAVKAHAHIGDTENGGACYERYNTWELKEPETDVEHIHGDGTCSNNTSLQNFLKNNSGNTVVLGGNVTVSSTITISNDVTLDLNGYKIDHQKQPGSVIYVQSGTFTLKDSKGTGTITGGMGTRKDYASAERDNDDPNGKPGEYFGGGVLVEQGATFIMYGGTITGNEATWGGGIAVAPTTDRNNPKLGGQLYLYGGVITDNEATSVNDDNLKGQKSAAGGKFGGGGGIYCGGYAIISPVGPTKTDDPSDGESQPSNIYITGNSTGTVNDLGGGGIYIENTGTVEVWNAVITGNQAAGQGGGVAGCLHSAFSNISPNTAAIYGNEAGWNQSAGYVAVTARLNAIDYHREWANDSGKLQKGTGRADDFFAAGYSVVSAASMNGGNSEWFGWKKEKTGYGDNVKFGDLQPNIGTTSKNDVLVSYGVIGLTANGIDDIEAHIATFGANKVFIEDNTSKMHGGGIGCNGTLTFGAKNFSYAKTEITLNATKTVADPRGADGTREGYTFKLYTVSNEKGSDPNEIGTATSDADGNISFKALSSIVLFGTQEEFKAGQEKTVYLMLEEVVQSPSNPNTPWAGMDYDDTARIIAVEVKRESTDKDIDLSDPAFGKENQAKFQTSVLVDKIQSVTVYKLVNKQPVKQYEDTTGATFTNGTNAGITSSSITLKNIVDGVNFENKMSYGSLKVTKKVADDTEKGEIPDYGKLLFDFTVTLTPERGRVINTAPVVQIGNQTVSGNRNEDKSITYKFQLMAGQTATIENIPAGTTYKVEETDTKAYDEQYDKDEVVVEANGIYEKDVKNVRHLVPLTIEKTVTWAETSKPYKGDYRFTFEVTINGNTEKKFGDEIKNDNGEYVYQGPGVYTITTEKGENTVTATIKDIPVGSTYSIKEVNVPDGFTWAKFTVNSKLEVTTDEEHVERELGEQTIADDAEAEKVEVENRYFKGQVSITKINNLDGVDNGLHNISREYRFKLEAVNLPYNTNYNGTTWDVVVKYNADDPNTVITEVTGDLLYGTYVIREVTDENGVKLNNYDWVKVTYTTEGGTEYEAVEGTPETGAGGITVVLNEDNSTYAITATNVYKRHLGSLSVTKTVEGNKSEENRGWTFIITLTSPETYVDLRNVVWDKPYQYKLTKAGVTSGPFTLDVTSNDGHTLVATITLTHGQTATIDNLPVGVDYKVDEVEANQDDYHTTSTGKEGKIAKDTIREVGFVNSRESYTTIRVTKNWEGDNATVRPASVTVKLIIIDENNNRKDGETRVLSADNNWYAEWTGLEPDYTYEVVEVDVPDGYISTAKGSGWNWIVTNTYNDTNTEPKTTSVTVNKEWVGDNAEVRPEGVWVQLQRNDVAYGEPVLLNAENNWTYTWSGADMLDSDDWSVVEVNVPAGYEATYSREGNVWTITNAYSTEVTVIKEWDDENDVDGIRPESVTVQLYRGMFPHGDPVTLDESNNWTYTWVNLPLGYDYQVVEIDVPEGYEASYEQVGSVWTVTNTHVPDEDLDIPEDDVPLANVPAVPHDPDEEFEIPEDDVPLATVPNTGDNSHVWGFFALFSGIGLALMSLFGKKKEDDAE